MQKPSTTSLQVGPKTKTWGQRLAKNCHRPSFRQDALAAWNHYQFTGLHLAAEEADTWLAKLEAGKNAPVPACHI